MPLQSHGYECCCPYIVITTVQFIFKAIMKILSSVSFLDEDGVIKKMPVKHEP